MDDSYHVANAKNAVSMMLGEDKRDRYLLTQKVDEVTGTQMKQIEVQKMEDDLTIKMLERQYLETKRNLIYTKKKLEEARNEAEEQTETMNQLLQANKAIVEKFHELKQYQNGSLLVSLNNAEKTYYNWKDKHAKLSDKLHTMLEKENYSYKLNEDISNRKKELTIEIKKQIDQKEKITNQRSEDGTQFDKNIENLQIQLTQEKADNDLKSIIEEKKKVISNLEVDHQSHQQQLEKEVNNALQIKNNLIQELQNNNKTFIEKKEFISKLQLEISLIVTDQSKQNEALLNAKAQKDMLLTEVKKNCQINDLTKKAFNENVTNLQNEQEKINVELQATEKNFQTNEEKLQQEFRMLRAGLEEKKKMIKHLESSEENLKQLKSIKSTKMKESDNSFKEKEDEIRLLSDKYTKIKQTLSERVKYDSELTARIKELQEIMNDKQTEMNLIENEEKNAMLNVMNLRKEKSKLALQNEKNIVDLTDKVDVNTNKESKKNKENWFDSDDSEESDDEFKIQKDKSQTSNSSAASQKKTVYDRDWDTEYISKSNTSRSQSEKLFEELLSQKSASTKNEDVFKVPQAHMTPARKKTYSQARKY